MLLSKLANEKFCTLHLWTQVEWDTDPGTREVQWIKTYADTGPNEVQSITTSAVDVDEVQQVITSATEFKEVQVSMSHLLCLYFVFAVGS